MPRIEQAARFLLLAIFALTVYLLYLVFEPFLPGIAWAIFLATAFYPVHVKICRLLQQREWASAIVTTLLIAALIIVPVSIVVTTMAKSAAGLVPKIEERIRVTASPRAAVSPGETAPVEMDEGVPIGEALESGADGPVRLPFINEIEGFLSNYIDVSQLDIEGTALSVLKNIGQALIEQTTPLLQNVLRTILQAAVMIVTMVVLFKEGNRVVHACQRILPLSDQDKEAVFERLHEVSRAIFYGVIMTAVIQGILGGIGWKIAGLPAATVAGIAMFFTALIPAVGTAVIWGPGVIFLFFKGSTGMAIFLLIWGAVVVSLVDNFLKPIFISGRTRMHMLLVFFGIVGGIMAFGFTGLFLGPLVITLFLSLIEVIRRDFLPQEAMAFGTAGAPDGHADSTTPSPSPSSQPDNEPPGGKPV